MHTSLWRLIETGENTGAFNMHLDEMLVHQLINDTGTPVVRFYQWKPWTISLGHHQDMADIDEQRCTNAGIDIVRRPTGGRAILHAEELTYSVVMRAHNEGVQLIYNRISKALVAGLNMFGVDVAFQRSQPDFARLYKLSSSISCFSSSARYEIEWNGKKLVGSAQRRYAGRDGEVVLQHGSILCGPAHHHLSDFLAIEDEHAQNHIREDLENKTTDLGQITGRTIDVDDLSRCLKMGFEKAWGISFIETGNIHSIMKDAHA